MKIITLRNTAVIIAGKADGKLPGTLKGKMFQNGLIIGSCRHLPVLLAHFEKDVLFIKNMKD